MIFHVVQQSAHMLEAALTVGAVQVGRVLNELTNGQMVFKVRGQFGGKVTVPVAAPVQVCAGQPALLLWASLLLFFTLTLAVWLGNECAHSAHVDQHRLAMVAR